jgi:polyisoprenoid-binding protein YceI
MATWIFEPGHTETEFRGRHMMVSWVRGLFKDVHGRLELDWDRCLDTTFEGEIDATGIWTGEPTRDAHLRSADFLDVENHPKISFRGHFTKRTAGTAFKGEVELTIRGVTRTVPLDIAYIGEWRTRRTSSRPRRGPEQRDRPHPRRRSDPSRRSRANRGDRVLHAGKRLGVDLAAVVGRGVDARQPIE